MGRLARTLRSPLAWLLAAALVLRVVGLTWGLPASDGWDNDGIAPRDFLPGLVDTFTPGKYFTYPPAQLALLTIATLPVTIVMLVRAPSLAPADLVAEAIKVPYMTSFAIVARLVTAAMSLAILAAMAKTAEEVAGKRAGLCAAAVCGVNAVFTYYSHTTNLDVPYMFWASLALLAATRAVARHEPRRLRRFAVFAALAVATKDQAYALFLLGAPASLALWWALDPWPRANARVVLKEVAFAAAIAVAIVLVVDGAVTNPSGFRARVAFLTGPASQPFAYYSADATGRLYAFADSFLRFDWFYPLAFAPVAILGVVRGARVPERAARAASFVPLAAILSFTLLFNCTARRDEHRFLLPQMILWSVYAGIGLEAVLFVRARLWRVAGRAAMTAAFAWGVFRCADVDANLVLDPRYDAEAYLREHVAPGDTIEVYGNNVYLPRLPSQARAWRVGPEAPSARSPLPGVEERQDLYSDVALRDPKWIVINEVYARQYMFDARPEANAKGRVASQLQIQSSADADATTYFRALFAQELGYRFAHVSTWTSRVWPRLDIHGATARDIWVFEKK